MKRCLQNQLEHSCFSLPPPASSLEQAHILISSRAPSQCPAAPLYPFPSTLCTTASCNVFKMEVLSLLYLKTLQWYFRLLGQSLESEKFQNDLIFFPLPLRSPPCLLCPDSPLCWSSSLHQVWKCPSVFLSPPPLPTHTRNVAFSRPSCTFQTVLCSHHTLQFFPYKTALT